jgi:hypothetical protein
VLVSRKYGKDRYTTRIERFSTNSDPRVPDDFSRESGKAYTVTWFRDFSDHVRGGLEYVKVDGNRPGAAFVGGDPRSGGSTITLEVRLAY